MKTEIIPLDSMCKDEDEQCNRYIVRLKNKAEDEYCVTIHPESIDVFDEPSKLVEDKKIIKFVSDELLNYLSDSITITSQVIESIEDKVKSLKIDRLRLREIMRK